MKRILADASVNQTRIAVVDDGELIELIYESKRSEGIVGNIYCGRVANVLPGMQAAFIDIGENKNAYLYYGEKSIHDKSEKPKNGEEFLVQVEKPPTGAKGAVVTRKISFPGKFVVVIPNDEQIGISKKILDSRERMRIKEIVCEFLPENFGVIVRTEGAGQSRETYANEITALIKTAQRVIERGAYMKAPTIAHKDSSAVVKAAREVFTDDIDEFLINNKEEYMHLLDVYALNGLDNSRIKLYSEDIPIFENYFIESQTERAFNKTVWLKSGGFLVIEQTEACVVIDVNTGKYTGKKDLQSTILQTNIEAAVEVAKQLRLRNLSGIIIVDFIDMKTEENKTTVRKKLEEAVNLDRIKTVVVGMTELGLMQITRQKKNPPISQLMTTVCRNCGGLGRVYSLDWTVDKIRRTVESVFSQTVFDKVTIKGDKRLLQFFAGENNVFKNGLEEYYGKKIELCNIENMPFGYFEIEKIKMP